MKKNTMLMILDGFGERSSHHGNAVYAAKTPNLDRMLAQYPHTTLGACGLDVGLPEGQMGNSEVGHLNIGAGRIVYQELTHITKDIEDGAFFANPALHQGMDHAIQNNSTLHLLGLLSDGGVHSHILHLMALLDLAKKKGVSRVSVHAILDGRDVPPRCADRYIKELEHHMQQIGLGQISTISGRYYTMDRDNRWERIQLSYDCMTQGKGELAATAAEALESAYDREENDEFVKPTRIINAGEHAVVEDGDSLILFNFRPDRARQITRCFVDDSFTGFSRTRRPQNLSFVCMTQYDAEMPNVLVAYPPQSLKNTLGEYLSRLGKRQLRIAETEKYAHVTFFFNGGVEAPNNGEDRILVPSPKVATYDLKPEMSAYEVTDRVVEQIEKEAYDVIILNFANADMVGHTGIMEAAVTAVEDLDLCIGRIADALNQHNGQLLLTADHGNADLMLDDENHVITSHSLSVVPFLVMTDHPVTLREGGRLCDIAPTLLQLMDIPKPEEMTGTTLIQG